MGWKKTSRDEKTQSWDERLKLRDEKKTIRDGNKARRDERLKLWDEKKTIRDGKPKLLERHSTPFNVDKNIESKRASTLNSLRVEPQN